MVLKIIQYWCQSAKGARPVVDNANGAESSGGGGVIEVEEIGDATQPGGTAAAGHCQQAAWR